MCTDRPAVTGAMAAAHQRPAAQAATHRCGNSMPVWLHGDQQRPAVMRWASTDAANAVRQRTCRRHAAPT